MVVRVHQSRHDQLSCGVDNLDTGFSWQVRADAFYPLAADQDIGLTRLVDVAIVVVDASAADQNARDLRDTGHPFCSRLQLSPRIISTLAAMSAGQAAWGHWPAVTRVLSKCPCYT